MDIQKLSLLCIGGSDLDSARPLDRVGSAINVKGRETGLMTQYYHFRVVRRRR